MRDIDEPFSNLGPDLQHDKEQGTQVKECRKASMGVAETGNGRSYESIELRAASPGTPGENGEASWLEVVPVGAMVGE